MLLQLHQLDPTLETIPTVTILIFQINVRRAALAGNSDEFERNLVNDYAGAHQRPPSATPSTRSSRVRPLPQPPTPVGSGSTSRLGTEPCVASLLLYL